MVAIKDMEMPSCCGECNCSGTGVCKEWVYLNGYDLGKKRADTCPLVEIEERKGKWILIDKKKNIWKCTKCIELGKDDWWQLNSGTPQDNKMDYCPHCGAEMRGSEE